MRTARKHLYGYTSELAGAAGFRQRINAAVTAAAQRTLVGAYFAQLADAGDRLRYDPAPWRTEALAA